MPAKAVKRYSDAFGPILGLDATNQHAPASNTAAVVTVAADPNRPIGVCQIFYSYSGTPTGGSLKIEDGVGSTVWGPFAITSSGLQNIVFTPGLCGTKNTAMVVTLAAGGAGVSGVVGVTPIVVGQ